MVISEKFIIWMTLRGMLENMEISRVWNIGAGGKTILGRRTASRVLQAIHNAGYELVKKPESE